MIRAVMRRGLTFAPIAGRESLAWSTGTRAGSRGTCRAIPVPRPWSRPRPRRHVVNWNDQRLRSDPSCNGLLELELLGLLLSQANVLGVVLGVVRFVHTEQIVQAKATRVVPGHSRFYAAGRRVPPNVAPHCDRVAGVTRLVASPVLERVDALLLQRVPHHPDDRPDERGWAPVPHHGLGELADEAGYLRCQLHAHTDDGRGAQRVSEDARGLLGGRLRRPLALALQRVMPLQLRLARALRLGRALACAARTAACLFARGGCALLPVHRVHPGQSMPGFRWPRLP